MTKDVFNLSFNKIPSLFLSLSKLMGSSSYMSCQIKKRGTGSLVVQLFPHLLLYSKQTCTLELSFFLFCNLSYQDIRRSLHPFPLKSYEILCVWY